MKPHLCMVVIACAAYVCAGPGSAQSGKSSSDATSQSKMAQTGASSASPVRRSIGTAEMQTDGSIDLYLKTDPGQIEINSGSVGSMQMNVKPGDSDYQRWIKQVGGLKIGERKAIPPLGDDFYQATADDSGKTKPKKNKPAKTNKTH